MNILYEYIDKLNTPFECFLFDTKKEVFPIRQHWHYFMEILLIEEGTAFISCNNKSYYATKCDLILFPPTCIHAIQAADGLPLKYYVLKFDLNQMNNAVHSTDVGIINFMSYFKNSIFEEYSCHLFPFSRTENKEYASTCHRIFEECMTEMSSQKLGYHSMVAARLSQLLLLLIRFLSDAAFFNPPAYSQSLEETDINTITEYIEQHLCENISVEELATICNMSYSHFAKTFRTLYGQSCKKYMNFLRLCKAENMLMFTNQDLNYISQECGFADCSHLIRLFKEKYGITPHQYRLKNRN